MLESGLIGQQNSATMCENIPLEGRFGVKLLFYPIIKNCQTILQSPSHDVSLKLSRVRINTKSPARNFYTIKSRIGHILSCFYRKSSIFRQNLPQHAIHISKVQVTLETLRVQSGNYQLPTLHQRGILVSQVI